jgi:hypothetical protein
MRSFLFYMSPRLRQRRVLYRTLTFKNKENILGVAATKKDVLQQGCEAGTPSIENTSLQVANSKQQTRNSNETMAQKLTRQRGMTEAQLENLQTATTGPTACKVEEQQTSEQPQRGPTAAAGPQLCKVESNNNNQHRTNQRKSINQ